MKESILLIACGMIQDEMSLALKNTGIKYDTIWMSAELHNNPDLLNQELQKKRLIIIKNTIRFFWVTETVAKR